MMKNKVFYPAMIFAFLTACSSLHEGPMQGLNEVAPAPTTAVSSSAPSAPTTDASKKDASKSLSAMHASILPETDLNKWELIEEKDQFKSYRSRDAKMNDAGVVAFRGEGTIPVSIAHVVAVFIDETIRKEWVDSLVETRRLRKFDELNSVEYNHTSVPWPFQDRDFVYRVQAKVKKKPTQISITLQSVEDPLMPEQPGKVRGKIIYSYYWIQESMDHTSTRIVVEMAVDPAGAIPSWLAALSQKKWPYNTLSGLSRLSARPGLVISEELKRFLY